MPIAPDIAGRKRLRRAGFALAGCLVAGAAPGFAATLRISWTSNGEADLAGYRLRYGTLPGAYLQTFDAGLANSCLVPGIVVGLRYHFVLLAYDAAGNESAPSGEITARIPTTHAAPPVVESAAEAGSRSLFAVRGRTSFVTVHGDHFQADATIDIGPGIVLGAPSRDVAGDLLVRADIAPSAALGGRTVTVTNPDQGIGSRSDALSIVKDPDVNADCAVDAVDLNLLARAWNETGDEARYRQEADLDGDGYIGPDDLAIFVQYFGRVFPGCP
jgi:hypothetical protein